MKSTESTARPNQKTRTRKDLLQAAARLMKQGRKPALEDVAAEALVSRATAYRYFPSVEALLLEASLDMLVPDAESLFAALGSDEPVTRVERVDAALDEMISANEVQLRMMLANSLQHSLEPPPAGAAAAAVPARQNRRLPLIEAALAPAREQFLPQSLQTLSQALALVVGTEAMLVCKDVLRLDDEQARQLRRWAIRALIDAARKPAPAGPANRGEPS